MFFKDYPLALRSCHDVRAATLSTIKGDLDYFPGSAYRVESDIVSFYALISTINQLYPDDYHVMGEGDAKILRAADELFTPILRRMINYLTVVCIRECRHYKSFPVEGASDLWNEVVGDVKGSDGTQCVNSLYEDKTSNNVPLGDLLEGASACFGSKGWGGSFGGKAWKTISDHTLKMVTGEISPEVFVDQAFSLQHNTTTVFNKSVIYRYESVDKITRLLDLQAHGSIGVAFSHGLGDPKVRTFIAEVCPDIESPDISVFAGEAKEAVKALGFLGKVDEIPSSGEYLKVCTYQKIATPEKVKIMQFLGKQVAIQEPVREAPETGPKLSIQSVKVA